MNGDILIDAAAEDVIESAVSELRAYRSSEDVDVIHKRIQGKVKTLIGVTRSIQRAPVMAQLASLLELYGLDLSRPLSEQEARFATRILVELAEMLWPDSSTPQNIAPFRRFMESLLA